MKLKAKKLLVIEQGFQVNDFLEYFNEENFEENFNILALNPSVQAILLKKNINFFNTEDFFSNDDHIEVLKKGGEIFEALEKDFSICDIFGIKNAYKTDFSRLFRLHFLNYCLSQISIMHNAILRLNPSELILPISQKPNEFSKGIDLDDSIIGYLGEFFAKKNQITFKLKGNLNSSQRKNYFFIFIQKIIFEIQLYFLSLFSKEKKILWATNISYNIPRLVNLFKEFVYPNFTIGISSPRKINKLISFFTGQNWNFFNFPPPASKKNTKDFLKKYDELITGIEKKIKNNLEDFKYLDVSLDDLIIGFLNKGLRYEILKTFNGSYAFERVTKVKKPFLVISNQAASYHYAIGEHCKIKNINGILVSHGSHVLSEDKYARDLWSSHSKYMTVTDFPFVAAQTPQIKNFLSNQKKLYSEILKTGPLLFSNKRSIDSVKEIRKTLFPEHSEKKIILHAATPFLWKYFLPYVNLTADEYIKTINDLIEEVDKIENLYLVLRIRLKSFPGMKLEEIKSLFVESKSYEVRVDGNFSDFLLGCDLLTSFSSTVIEEALQLERPVLQYDPYNRYSHVKTSENADKHKQISTIYYTKSKKDLGRDLSWIFENHLIDKTLNSTLNWKSYNLKPEKEWMKKLVREIK
jgi:hypothetical protein